MASLKCIILFISCLILVAAASPIEQNDASFNLEPVLSRQVRSPEGGSVSATVSQDARGREASVQYNQNLYKSRDGRGTVDAYAQASRNFDTHRNDHGGGIQASWKF